MTLHDNTALLTDRYELTMVAAALADGTAHRPCTFEVFTRRLPEGRRYGVVAGTARFIEALDNFSFTNSQLEPFAQFLDSDTMEWLRNYRFSGSIEGYREGELFFPGSPILTIRGTFAEAVVLETLVLSILNHDSAVASAGARMVSAAGSRPIIEMGSRRTHEYAAVAAARAGYLAGMASTSNLEATRRYGVPGAGTSAHSFTLLHTGVNGPDERAAFAAQVARLGVKTTLLVDTYDITAGVAAAIEVAGTDLGGVRIDSGDLGVLARDVRAQLDSLGAHNTRIVVSGDLDEYGIAALRAEPVDAYGVGTQLVTGSGAPTAGMVYKLVEVDGIPVAKRASHKESHGGAKVAYRAARSTGTVIEEIIATVGTPAPELPGGISTSPLQIPMVADGNVLDGLPTLEDARTHLAQALVSLPWEGLGLSAGDPAISTRYAL